MKTKSDIQSRGTYTRVLVKLQSRIRCAVAVSLILIAVLLTCYSTIPNARRSDVQDIGTMVDVVPADEDGDAEYLDKRHEFLEQFFATGPGGVSPSAYKRALDAARGLPISPLLQGQRFISPETLQLASAWTSPIPPPIQHSYAGNASARIHILAIDPINANIVYTASLGGLAGTTDSGVTWRYLSDAWTSQSISSIAIDPNAHNFVYVGTGRDNYGPYGVGLYRSFDGGTTWVGPLGGNEFAGTCLRAIAVDPRASGSPSRTIIYAANGVSNNSGLWRSLDSGLNWTRVHQAGNNGIYDLAVDPSTFPSTLYISQDDGIFKSTNYGMSWTLIHGVLAGSRNRLSVINSTVYLLGPGDPGHNFYKSMDRGATWVQIPTNCYAGADSCADANHIGFSVFAVDPFNPNVILAGNVALYRTDNEGMTWTEIGNKWGNDPDPARRIHPDQKVIAFSRTVLGATYEGNDGGIVGSIDSGQRWINLNQNFPGALLYGVALSRDGAIIAGTQDSGVVFSDPFAPSGKAWDMIYGGDSAHNLIDPLDGAVGYFTMYRDYVFRRFNRTAPHSSVDIRPSQFDSDKGCSFFPAFSMNPSYPTHLIAACQHLVRTLDGRTVTPASWMTIGPSLVDPNRDPSAYGNYVTAAYEAPNNPNVIYAVRGWGTVFVTSNANQGNGAVWTQIPQGSAPGGISAVTVDPTNYQIAYLACNSGVYKTTDMGMTWTQRGVPDLVYHDVAIDPASPQHIFAASNAGVFASTDGGRTWGNMSDGIPAGMTVTALSFNATSRQLAASTYGRGVYMLNLNQVPTGSINLSAALGATTSAQ
jgi:photosystem II stability/assembly factor-like uncharacterized protein